MFTAITPTIDTAIQQLNKMSIAATSTTAIQPNLGGYSQIPSLQLVANEHGLAISGSSGSAVSVEMSMGKQLRWAHTNLSDFRRVISDHESTMNRIFRTINPFSGGNSSLSEAAHASGVFQRRPMFQAGTLTFAPVSVSAELGMDAQTLLSMFSSTNDAAISDAIAYWTGFASSMNTLASDLASVSSSLMSSNTGEVFIAANATMKGLAARATSIATASEVMKGHLETLPGVKAMAINTLSAIAAESKAIPNAGAQKAFEQAEVAAFLTGPYTAQLQTAIPRIPNLVSADAGSGVTSSVTAGATVAGRSGTAQIGLSPAGMTGSVHASTAPAGVTSTVPDSPTQMTNSTTPASAPAATQSTMPTGPQAMAPSASAPSPTPSGTTSTGMPTPVQPQAVSAIPRSASPATAPTGSSLPKGPQGMSANPGSTHSAATPQFGATNPAVFNRVGANNQAGLPQSAAFAPGSAAGSTNARSLGGAGLIGGMPGKAGSYGTTGVPSRAGGISGVGVLGGANGAGSAVGANNSARFTPTAGRGAMPLGTGSGGVAGVGGSGGSSAGGAGNSSQRGSGLMHTLANARGGGNAGSGAGAHGAHGAAATVGGRGARGGGATESSARRLTNVATIRANDADAFEQNEYQRELFGEAPVTIPAVIGHNVRG